MPDPLEKRVKAGRRARERKPLHESPAVAAWVFVGAIVVFLMFLVFVRVEPEKLPIIRFLMAVAAAFLSYFIIGRIGIKGNIRGFAISASGGAAFFVLLQFIFDPFQYLRNMPNPGPSPTAIQSPPPSPSSTPANPSHETVRTIHPTPSPTSAVDSKKPPKIDVRAILADGHSLTETGNPKDKEKALQLYRNAVAALNRADLPQGLLQEADGAYANHYDDAAREKYRGVLQVYLHNHQ